MASDRVAFRLCLLQTLAITAACGRTSLADLPLLRVELYPSGREGRLVRASVTLMLLLSGCTYTARYESEPAGARVHVDGVYRGLSPLELEMDSFRSSSYTLRFELEGYRPATQVISPTPDGGTVTFSNTWGTANVQARTHGEQRVYDYGARPTVRGTQTTNVTATGTQFTVTNTQPTYTWPTRFFCELVPLEPQATGA